MFIGIDGGEHQPTQDNTQKSERDTFLGET